METSNSQMFERAFQLHQSGQLLAADAIYHQILERDNNHVSSLQYLAVSAAQQGDISRAHQWIERALNVSPADPQLLKSLGDIFNANGELDRAIETYRQAARLSPLDPNLQYNLANALAGNQQIDEAIACYRIAIFYNPKFASAYNNLAVLYRQQGKLDAALGSYLQAIAANPNLAETHSNISDLFRMCGRIEEAIAAAQRAISLNPRSADAHNNLGSAFTEMGFLDDAILNLKRALSLRSAFPDALNNLANALSYAGKAQEAIAACRKAIALKPDWAEAHNNLGLILKDQKMLDDAIGEFRRAIAIKPNFSGAYNNLANTLSDNAETEEADRVYRQAVEIDPSNLTIQSGLILNLYYKHGTDPSTIASALQAWKRQSDVVSHPTQRHLNIVQRERILRIGYVSPDFRDHVVGRNVLPILARHDKNRYQIYCYAQIHRPDSMTEQFKSFADGWRSIVGRSDDKVAKQIQQDSIDILVDLSLHTADNRLLVFAKKPAPIQVSFAGYPGSTGLDAIDYCLSDEYLDPVNESALDTAAQTVHLPHSFWCFDPLDCSKISVEVLPALNSNSITFGCLNNFCKLNLWTIGLWANVLRHVNGSKILLLAAPGSGQRRIVEMFQNHGIDSARIEFVPHQSRTKYLETYHRIDIGLDTFPYNGHTTSLDSFWMGVPVVTLIGELPVSRAGFSQLSNLDLTELGAKSAEDFLKISVGLAGDIPRLDRLRTTLRQRMEKSPLMNCTQFARDIESAYRNMWSKWCSSAERLK